MRAARLLLWPAAVALGVAAEQHLYGWGDSRQWGPDVAVGWITIACGLIGWRRWPQSRTGPLLAAAGGAWFLGNFSSQALYLHRGPLVHAALAYPSGRAPGRTRRAAIAAGYAAAAVPSIWGSAPVAILLSLLLVAVAVHSVAAASPRERRARLAGVAASGSLALVFALTAAVRLASDSERAASATLTAYQSGVALFALGALVGLIGAAPRRPALTDLVVELGDSASGGLRDALARALGDPSLEIAFQLQGRAGYVDAGGRPVQLPSGEPGRRVTYVQRDGQPAVALVHDEGTLEDPDLLEAVDAAARLAAANARLHAEVRRQVAEVEESRRRLMHAGDEQRRRLEQGLRDGARRRLAEVDTALARRTNGDLSPVTAEKLERARDLITETLADLDELGAGLHPRLLTEQGLGPALVSVVRHSPLAVDLVVADGRYPAAVEAAAYFVCCEALANVAKHAAATRVSVRVRRGGAELLAEVTDDGRGGPTEGGDGSGLAGLADRVEALGGSLAVTSPSGGGMRVTARLPLERDWP